MSRFSLVSLAALYALPAMAQETTESVADVNFEAEQVLFRGNNDLGYRFPTNSWFGVVVRADVSADAEGELAAQSVMVWPDAMTQSWEGVEGGGELTVELGLDLIVEARLDGEVDFGFGSYDFANSPIVYEIWADRNEWFSTKFFDSLLLPGAATSAVTIAFNDASGSAAAWFWDPGLDYSIDLEPATSLGYTIVLDGDLQVQPDASITITGTSVGTRGRMVTAHDGEVLVPAPNTNDGEVEYESIWSGEASSRFDLVAGFVPDIRVVDNDDGSISGFSSTINNLLANYTTFTIPVGTDSRTIQSKNTDYTHDLPAIDTNQSSLDFGSILIDTESQLNLTVEDLGAIELWGDIVVEGDGFSISRPDLEVEAESEMMLTVTFRPGATGNFDGTLTLESNDPVNPAVAIPLSGNGIDETGDTGETPDTGDGGGGEAGIRGCGCSSTPGGSLAWLALIPAFGFVMRRRR